MTVRSVALLLLAAACLAIVCHAADEADLVTRMPYLSHKVDFRHYSGFLPVGNTTKRLHYWFVESQNDPAKDPLMIWLNGGPGCSSMLGLLYEHGPFVFPDEDIELALNPYSWNKLASVIYLEAPAGVGYSYAANPETDYLHDDNSTSMDNYLAVRAWFKKFPEYLTNELYISGESYGGIYVPTLAHRIHEGNKELPDGQKINLKGFIVGNGVADWKSDANAFVDYAWYHNLYSPATRAVLEKTCNGDLAVDSEECQKAVMQMRVEVGNVNLYDIYRKCYNETAETEKRQNSLRGDLPADLKLNGGAFDEFMLPWIRMRHHPHSFDDLLHAFGGRTHNHTSSDPSIRGSPGLTPPCVEAKGALHFLNSREVRKALHIPKEVGHWYMCSEEINHSYKIDFALGSFYLYPLLSEHYKVLVYSGDTDAAVPITGTLRWIDKLNMKVENPWRAWAVDGQLAGYVVDYDRMRFVSVKGTGHMVPQWKRAEAYYMLEKFLKQESM